MPLLVPCLSLHPKKSSQNPLQHFNQLSSSGTRRGLAFSSSYSSSSLALSKAYALVNALGSKNDRVRACVEQNQAKPAWRNEPVQVEPTSGSRKSRLGSELFTRLQYTHLSRSHPQALPADAARCRSPRLCLTPSKMEVDSVLGGGEQAIDESLYSRQL